MWPTCQYRLWPPRVLMTAWQGRSVEAIKNCWMFYHWWCSAVRRCESAWDGGFLCACHKSTASHRCSIGFKSGKRTGQNNIWTLWRYRHSWLARAAGRLAISCWNMHRWSSGAEWRDAAGPRLDMWCPCVFQRHAQEPSCHLVGFLPTPWLCRHQQSRLVACNLKQNDPYC